jgi:hypothetical protein
LHDEWRGILQEILSLQAKEEMVLAREVMTPDGRVLCGKGTALTTPIIDRILKMDISHIAVEGHPVEIEGEKTLEQKLADIQKRFSRVTHIQPLQYIKQRLMHRLVQTRKE